MDATADPAAEAAARQLAEETNASAIIEDLESRFVAVEKERDELRKKSEQLETQLKNQSSQISDKDETLRSMESNVAASQRERKVFEEKYLTMQEEKKVQQERRDRMEAEADSLRDEISRLTESNSNMAAKLSEADTKKILSDSSTIPIQYELERVRKELDSLTSHNKWLETELVTKSDLLVKTKTQHSKEAIELRTELDKAETDRDVLVSREEALTSTCEQLKNKVERLSNELYEHQQGATDETIAVKEELVAERRLVELQKEQLQRLEQRYNDVAKQANQMKELAVKASTESREEQDRIRTQLLKESEQALEQQSESYQGQIQNLEKQLEEANKRRIEAEDGLMASPPARRRLPRIEDAEGASGRDEQEPLGLTELFARLSETEDDLRAERTERRRLELYQQKILAEMQAKAPVLLRQRQEFELALEKYEEARGRLDDALEEVRASRQESSELQTELTRIQKTSRELELENEALAKQVQALLKSRVEGESSLTGGTGDEFSSALSIEELQTQNQRLLREHRRMTDAVNELEQKLQDDSIRRQLEDAQKELSSLHQERKRQETLVAGIVQQRDLYRALLAKHDSSITSGESSSADTAALMLAEEKSKVTQAENRNRQLENDLAKTRADLTSANLDKESLEERVKRYDAHTLELTTSLDKLQSELSASNASVARSEADASYHRDKCLRLEETIESARSEGQRANNARKELLSVNSELQQAVSAANAEVSRHEQQVRQTSMKLRLTETQLETAKAAETRVALEANSLRSELTRQGALLDSIQRIEASLSAKNVTEKDRLAEESQRLEIALEQKKRKHSIEIEDHLSRIRELEVEGKAAEKKKDDAMAQLIEAKKETLAAVTSKRELQSRISRLESELSAAKKKLGEPLTEDEEQLNLQTRNEALTSEIVSLRADFEAAKGRVSTYQAMAKSSEDALTELNKASQDFKKGSAKEMDELQNKLLTWKQENEAKQEMIAELTNDLANQRGDKEKAVTELKVEIEGLQMEIETMKKDSENAVSRLANVDAEIASYRADATSAQNNYERELALHSSARTALRSAREEVDSEMRLRKLAETKLETTKAGWDEEQKNLVEEKSALEVMVEQMEKSLEESRGQNKVLHSQLSTLGDIVEKTRSEQIAAASTEAPDQDTEGPTDGAASELDTIQKEVSEMRELVRFMRSEGEILQSQLDSARRTAERERASYSVTKRSLDEARAELKLMQGKQAQSGDDSETNATLVKELQDKAKQAEEQLTLLRESNTLLREEAEKLELSVADKDSELKRLTESVEPGEERLRELEVEKLAMEAEKASLSRELDAWKGRVQSLVSKFHQIDPDEHEKVVKEVEALTKECNILKSQKEAAESESAGAKGVVIKLNKELSQQKKIVETQKKALSRMTTEKEAMSKSSSAVAVATKERDQLKDEVKKMKTDAASKDTELKGANQRNEALKTRLRQFQKVIMEMKENDKKKDKELAELKEKSQKSQRFKTVEETPLTEKPAVVESKKVEEEGTASKPVAIDTRKAKTEAAKTLPRVPAEGFRYGPDESLPSTEATESKAVAVSVPAVLGKVGAQEGSTPAPVAGTEKQVTRPPVAQENAVPAGSEEKEIDESIGAKEKDAEDSHKRTASMETVPPQGEKTERIPKKRKAETEPATKKKKVEGEAGIRAKLMQKRAAESKAAKRVDDELSEEKDVDDPNKEKTAMEIVPQQGDKTETVPKKKTTESEAATKKKEAGAEAGMREKLLQKKAAAESKAAKKADDVRKPVVATEVGSVQGNTPESKKRKADESAGSTELSMREKLMEKKRKLAAELKKAEMKKAMASVEATVDAEEQEGQEENRPNASLKLSAEAKEWIPPQSKGHDVKVEDQEAEAPAVAIPVASDETEPTPADDVNEGEVTTPGEDAAETEEDDEDENEDEQGEGNDDSNPEAADESETKESSAEAKTEAMPSPFSKPFGAAAPFQSSALGTSVSMPMAFGASSTLATQSGASSGFGTKQSGEGSTFGSSFLNIKPPGSSTAPLTFGSSAITLPTPSKPLSPSTSSFGIFGQQIAPSSGTPFGGGMPQAKPLFGSSGNVQVEAEEDPVDGEEEDEVADDDDEGQEEDADNEEADDEEPADEGSADDNETNETGYDV